MQTQSSNIIYQFPRYPLFRRLLNNVSKYNFESEFKEETKGRIRQLDYLIKKIKFYSINYLNSETLEKSQNMKQF